MPLRYAPASLPSAKSPLRLAGAWVMKSDDPRLGGLSGLAIDQGRLLAVTDRGAVIWFDQPGASATQARLKDLRIGPGNFGKKWSRDAESIVRDPHGRGWWVGYEQAHSLWLYDDGFDRALAAVDLHMPAWPDNRGAEGLLSDRTSLLVTAENGRDAVEVDPPVTDRVELDAGAEVADATRAPDGSAWLLLRSKGWRGIRQSIAPLIKTAAGYRAGQAWPLPKGAFDNYEGMAIAPNPDGSWRFWLVTDDGHRIMARTLLVALDYMPAGHDKSPATRAGLSKKPSGQVP